MVLIVNKRSPWEPLIEGLSQGLESYGQMYQQGKKRESFIDALEKSGKYTKEEARLIASAPESIGKEFIKGGTSAANIARYEAARRGEYVPSAVSIPSQQAQPTYTQPSPMQQPVQREPLSENLNQLAQLQKQRLQQSMFGGQPEQIALVQQPQAMQPGGYLQQLQQAAQQAVQPGMQPMQQPGMQPTPQETPQLPRDLTQRGAAQAGRPVETPTTKADELYKRAERERNAANLASLDGNKVLADQYNENANSLEKRAKAALEGAAKEGYQEKNIRIKEHQAVKESVDKIFAAGETARDSMEITAKQRDMYLKGNITPQGKASFAKFLDSKLGEGIGDMFRTSDTQAINKLTAKRFENISDVIQGVPRGNTMIEMYLKGYVRDTNSKEAAANIMKLTDLADIKKEWRSDLAEEIVKANDNYYPIDFNIKLSALERERKQDLANRIEKHLFGVAEQEKAATGAVTPSAITGLAPQTTSEQPKAQPEKAATAFNVMSFGPTEGVPDGMRRQNKSGQIAIKVNGQWVPYGK